MYDSHVHLNPKYNFRANAYSVLNLKKSDRIFIGKNPSYEMKSDTISELELNPFEKIQFDEQVEINSNILSHNITINAIYICVYLFVLFIFIFLLKDFNSENINLIHLNSASLLATGFYFFILCLVLPFVIRKRKIKLQVKNNHLHLNSFPAFHHSIPIKTISRCLININEKNNFNNQNYFETNRQKKSIKINLESGISITFKNGKKVMIGSSNSA